MRQHRSQRPSEHAHRWSPISQSHRRAQHFTFSVHLQVKRIQRWGDRRARAETQAHVDFNAIIKSALITCCHTDMCYKYPHATQSESVVYPQAAAPHSHSTEPLCSELQSCEKRNGEKCFKLRVWIWGGGEEEAPENLCVCVCVSHFKHSRVRHFGSWCNLNPMSQSINKTAPPAGQSEQL